MADKTAWVSGGPYKALGGVHSAKGGSLTGTDDPPADGDETAGLSLKTLGGFGVHVESDAVPLQNLTAGSLKAYVMSPADKKWYPCPDLDLVVAGGAQRQAFAGFAVSSDAGRIAYVPTGLGGRVLVYINGTPPRGGI